MNTLTETVLQRYSQHPRVAVLMSGLGSNARALLQDSELRDLYDVAAVATDQTTSNAATIAQAHGLTLVQKPSGPFRSKAERAVYFDALGWQLRDQGVEAVFYAGFMRIATPDFCEAFPGVNVHPADLTIKGLDGLAKYRGMQAMSAMRHDLGYVASTVHVVDCPVDSGSALSVSELVRPAETVTDSEVHDVLKQQEHVLYAQTLKLLGRGAVSVEQLPLRPVGGLE